MRRARHVVPELPESEPEPLDPLEPLDPVEELEPLELPAPLPEPELAPELLDEALVLDPVEPNSGGGTQVPSWQVQFALRQSESVEQLELQPLRTIIAAARRPRASTASRMS